MKLSYSKASGQTFVAKCISLAALNEHDQDLAHQEARKAAEWLPTVDVQKLAGFPIADAGPSLHCGIQR